MATGRARSTRLRLTFNFRSGTKSRDTIRGFASAMVQDVAINAADEMWVTIKAKIEKQLAVDAFREIARMAQLYKQLTIGISGDRAGLHGKLTPASAPAKGQEANYSYSLGSGPWSRWPRRGGLHYYLTRKRREVGHTRWFQHRGLLGSVMGRGKTFTAAFGPVKVDVSRHATMSPRDANRTAESQATREARAGYMRRFDTGVRAPSGSSVSVHVASIRVEAMRNITPAMLPAIRDGNIDNVAPDGRKTGLIGAFPKEVGWHLAGGQKFVPYRHTIEPFLGFVLTRAIPNAVARRLQDTLNADIRAVGRGRGEQFAGATPNQRRFGR